jgi:hypothetical protein
MEKINEWSPGMFVVMLKTRGVAHRPFPFQVFNTYEKALAFAKK